MFMRDPPYSPWERPDSLQPRSPGFDAPALAKLDEVAPFEPSTVPCRAVTIPL